MTALLACSVLFVVPLLQDGAATDLQFEPVPDHLALVDLDGDGVREYLNVRERNLRLERGPGQEPLRAVFPGEATLWTVADHDGDGTEDLLALVDGEALLRLELRQAAAEAAPEAPAAAAAELSWSEPLLQGLGGANRLPRGHRPANFLRDVNRDGRVDLVLPLGAQMKLFFGDGQGGFAAGPELGVATLLAMEVGDRLRDDNLLGRVRRRLSVPQIGMRDVSGDGQPDLQIAEGLKIHQYIAGAGGLPGRPTVTVDLELFEDSLGEIRFDPSNVAGLTRYAVWEQWEDLNRDGAQDLIVLVGGTVVIYMGGKDGLDLRRPRDQLPTRGNVLYALATPVDGDPLPDLVLLRIEDVSLARALSWILFSVSIKLDILAYKGQGNGRFEHRPLEQSKTVEIELPSVLDLAKGTAAADALRRTVVRLADLDGDGQSRDLVVLEENGTLKGYRGLVQDETVLEQVTDRFLGELLRQPKSVALDVDTLSAWLLGRTSLLVSLARDQKPSFRVEPPAGWEAPHAMTAVDVDGDRKEEILVLRRIAPEDGQDDAARRRLVGYLYRP